MEFNEYLKEKLAQATEDYFGIYADGYENGKNASENTKRFPREKNPLIEINSLNIKFISQTGLFLLTEIILPNTKRKTRI